MPPFAIRKDVETRVVHANSGQGLRGRHGRIQHELTLQFEAMVSTRVRRKIMIFIVYTPMPLAIRALNRICFVGT